MHTAATRGVALAFASVLVLVLFSAPGARADGSVPPTEVAQARSQIEATIDQMRATSFRVRDELRAARRRGTRQQIACVDEALSRSDVAVRRARELGDEILVAYARDDAPRAHAAQRRLAELREAQRLAAADATSCAPRVVVASSGVTVKLEVDPKLPR